MGMGRVLSCPVSVVRSWGTGWGLSLGRKTFDVEDAGLRVWEGDRGAAGGGLGRCREEEELAAGGDSRLCCWEGGCHIVDGAKGDDVEQAVGGHGFDATGPYLDVLEGEGADGFAEEGGFFVLGLGERDLDFGVKEGDGEPGEAGSGAEVEEGFGFGRDVQASEEALAEVTADDLLGIADGGEVGAGVPLEEEIEVRGEPGEDGGGWVYVGAEERGDLRFGEIGHGRDFGRERLASDAKAHLSDDTTVTTRFELGGLRQKN